MARKRTAAKIEAPELTEERWATLLAYCRVTGEELEAGEVALMEECFWAAVGYMTGAGISYPAGDRPRQAQYNMVVNALVLDAWDKRDATLMATVVAENPVLRRTMTQLKLSEPVPDLGT